MATLDPNDYDPTDSMMTGTSVPVEDMRNDVEIELYQDSEEGQKDAAARALHAQRVAPTQATAEPEAKRDERGPSPLGAAGQIEDNPEKFDAIQSDAVHVPSQAPGQAPGADPHQSPFGATGGSTSSGSNSDTGKPTSFEQALSTINPTGARERRFVIVGDDQIRNRFYDRLAEMGKLKYQGGVPMIGVSRGRAIEILAQVAAEEKGASLHALTHTSKRSSVVGKLIGFSHRIDVMVVGKSEQAVHTALKEVGEGLAKMHERGALKEKPPLKEVNGERILDVAADRSLKIHSGQPLGASLASAKNATEKWRAQIDAQKEEKFNKSGAGDKAADNKSPSASTAQPVNKYAQDLADGAKLGFSTPAALRDKNENKQERGVALLHLLKNMKDPGVSEVGTLQKDDRQKLLVQMAAVVAKAEDKEFGKPGEKALTAESKTDGLQAPQRLAKLIDQEKTGDASFVSTAKAAAEQMVKDGLISEAQASRVVELIGKEATTEATKEAPTQEAGASASSAAEATQPAAAETTAPAAASDPADSTLSAEQQAADQKMADAEAALHSAPVDTSEQATADASADKSGSTKSAASADSEPSFPEQSLVDPYDTDGANSGSGDASLSAAEAAELEALAQAEAAVHEEPSVEATGSEPVRAESETDAAPSQATTEDQSSAGESAQHAPDVDPFATYDAGNDASDATLSAADAAELEALAQAEAAVHEGPSVEATGSEPARADSETDAAMSQAMPEDQASAGESTQYAPDVDPFATYDGGNETGDATLSAADAAELEALAQAEAVMHEGQSVEATGSEPARAEFATDAAALAREESAIQGELPLHRPDTAERETREELPLHAEDRAEEVARAAQDETRADAHPATADETAANGSQARDGAADREEDRKSSAQPVASSATGLPAAEAAEQPGAAPSPAQAQADMPSAAMRMQRIQQGSGADSEQKNTVAQVASVQAAEKAEHSKATHENASPAAAQTDAQQVRRAAETARHVATLAKIMYHPPHDLTTRSKKWNEANVMKIAKAVDGLDPAEVAKRTPQDRATLAAYSTWVAKASSSGQLPGFSSPEGKQLADRVAEKAVSLNALAEGVKPDSGTLREISRADKMVSAMLEREQRLENGTQSTRGQQRVNAPEVAERLVNAVYSQSMQMDESDVRHILKNASGLTPEALSKLSPEMKAKTALALTQLATDARNGMLGDEFKQLPRQLQSQIRDAQEASTNLYHNVNKDPANAAALAGAHIELNLLRSGQAIPRDTGAANESASGASRQSERGMDATNDSRRERIGDKSADQSAERQSTTEHSAGTSSRRSQGRDFDR